MSQPVEHNETDSSHIEDTQYAVESALTDHAEAGHEVAGEHGEAAEHSEGGKHHPEIPNFITVLNSSSLKDTATVKFLHHWETQAFTFLIVIIMSIVIIKAMKPRKLIPTKWQNAIEFLVEGLCNMYTDILGPKFGKKYAFYSTGLFLFIWVNNLAGLVPFFKAPTSMIQTTASLAICTFFYVQYICFKENGLKGYGLHMLGNPTDVVGWCLVPLMLPLHIIEEFAKPLSLALRLFGNILGEDILLAVFLMLGISLMGAMGAPSWMPGLPLHFPFFFLALLTSTIQALVFSLLACIYIFMALPHESN